FPTTFRGVAQRLTFRKPTCSYRLAALPKRVIHRRRNQLSSVSGRRVSRYDLSTLQSASHIKGRALFESGGTTPPSACWGRRLDRQRRKFFLIGLSLARGCELGGHLSLQRRRVSAGTFSGEASMRPNSVGRRRVWHGCEDSTNRPRAECTRISRSHCLRY